MTIENEKLADALNWLKDRIDTKELVKASLDWQDMKAEADYEKMNIDNLKVIEQAARRYAEVLPLLGQITELDKVRGLTHYGWSIRVRPILEQIAAIVARGE